MYEAITDGVREQVTIDVTNLPPHYRKQLLDTVRMLMDAAEAAMNYTPSGENADIGWTQETVRKLLDRLAVGNRSIQAKAFQQAIDNLGVVTRAEIYDIGGYPESRKLMGFAKPVKRIAELMKAAGEIPAEAETDVFTPVYDQGVSGYQQAKGYRVPAEIIDLMSE